MFKLPTNPIPVSYTHLDVYKRQKLHREPLAILCGKTQPAQDEASLNFLFPTVVAAENIFYHCFYTLQTFFQTAIISENFFNYQFLFYNIKNFTDAEVQTLYMFHDKFSRVFCIAAVSQYIKCNVIYACLLYTSRCV